MSRALEIAEACVMQHGQKAWRLAYSLMRNSADADDLLQQSFIIAWRKADTFPEDATWPWLAGIISLEARNLRRKRARHAHSPLHDAAESPMNLDPAHDSQRRELSARLHSAMGNLAPDQREALALTHIGGLTQQQAANALEVPLNTLKARVRRGLASLRGELSAEENELSDAMHSMPIALPVGGLAAAQAKWVAGVKAEAAVFGGVAATAISKKALIATAAAGIVMLVAIWLVLQDDPNQVNAPSSDLAERAPAYEDSGLGYRPDINRPGAGGEENDPDESGEYEGIPGKDPEGTPNRPFKLPPPDEGEEETPANDTGEVEAATEQPEAIKEPPEEQPFQIEAASNEQPQPVLWIEDWPPVEWVETRGVAHRNSDLKDYFKVMASDEPSLNEQWSALEKLPTGEKDAVPAIREVLKSEWGQFRLAGIELIRRESDPRVLKIWWQVVEETFGDGHDNEFAELLLHALLRNQTFLDDHDWDELVTTFVYKFEKTRLPLALLRTFLIEMGHYRGDLNDEDAQDENRWRGRLLIEMAEWLAKEKEKREGNESKKAARLPENLQFWLEIAVECLLGVEPAELWDKRERGRLASMLKRKSFVVEPLLKQRHYLELDGVDWTIWSVERESRGANPPVLCLPDIGWDPGIYLPWMLPLDREYPCLLLEHPDYGQVMERNPFADASLPETHRRYPVSEMTAQLELMRRELGVKQVGLVGWGLSTNPLLQYCIDHPSRVSFWLATHGWISESDTGLYSKEVRSAMFRDTALAAFLRTYEPSEQVSLGTADEEWANTFLTLEGRVRFALPSSRLGRQARGIRETLIHEHMTLAPAPFQLIPPREEPDLPEREQDVFVIYFQGGEYAGYGDFGSYLNKFKVESRGHRSNNRLHYWLQETINYFDNVEEALAEKDERKKKRRD